MSDFLKEIMSLFSQSFPFVLLIACGLFLTLKGSFFQFRLFPKCFKLVKRAFKANKDKEGLTSYKSACTSLSATVGTGNIAGVASAIALGGAGAVFWMWISALVGMAIKYAEISLAIVFREKRKSGFAGGPMYYIKNGFENGKFWAALFAVATLFSMMFTGSITQTNAAAVSLQSSLKTKLIFGIVFAIAVGVVILGGADRIGAVTEKAVPFMSVIYILLCAGVILIKAKEIPLVFNMILKGAFSPMAVTGGAVASVQIAMFTGASRGIFSNEAGLGTSAMAHSVAIDADAKMQGLFGIFEVFVDTLLICTLTALTILLSSVKIDYGSVASSELVGDALGTVYGTFSQYLLSAMLIIFAFSSVIGWALYGEICMDFLFKNRGKGLLNCIYLISCFLGAICDVSLAWNIAALFNGIMLCINLPAIFLLSNKIKGVKYD